MTNETFRFIAPILKSFTGIIDSLCPFIYHKCSLQTQKCVITSFTALQMNPALEYLTFHKGNVLKASYLISSKLILSLLLLMNIKGFLAQKFHAS